MYEDDDRWNENSWGDDSRVSDDEGGTKNTMAQITDLQNEKT